MEWQAEEEGNDCVTENAGNALPCQNQLLDLDVRSPTAAPLLRGSPDPDSLGHSRSETYSMESSQKDEENGSELTTKHQENWGARNNEQKFLIWESSSEPSSEWDRAYSDTSPMSISSAYEDPRHQWNMKEMGSNTV
ncbi:hypothetical protein DFH08DRAFT_817074 [Mycena albidolilacea]|uniref:Uncharacterized protein n=1 Tax=Mycena albidolilacea TaxID=1033008 RepID=A0AAD6ZJT9_9AGAR|nr:hypothetical protein DFH08DRAFT_817074 [Mycena albidolilacea]